MSGREKDVEILALRHQVRILQRQLGGQRVRFEPSDRALLAALLGTFPRGTLRRLHAGHERRAKPNPTSTDDILGSHGLRSLLPAAQQHE